MKRFSKEAPSESGEGEGFSWGDVGEEDLGIEGEGVGGAVGSDERRGDREGSDEGGMDGEGVEWWLEESGRDSMGSMRDAGADAVDSGADAGEVGLRTSSRSCGERFAADGGGGSAMGGAGVEGGRAAYARRASEPMDAGGA